MTRFTGDSAKLAALQVRIQGLSTTGTNSIAKVAGAAALSELQKGFRASVDPYGKPWMRLKYRKGKPLLDTARLRASFSVKTTEKGFVVSTNTAYAKFHQRGTKGRTKASRRSQAVNERGKFSKPTRLRAEKIARRLEILNESIRELMGLDPSLAKKLLSKQRRIEKSLNKSIQEMQASGRGHVAFKVLNFKAGGGAIPRRMMVPEGNIGLRWGRAINAAARREMSRILKR